MINIALTLLRGSDFQILFMNFFLQVNFVQVLQASKISMEKE